MESRQAAPPGTNVYGADGDLLGTVQSSDGPYMVVDSGDDQTPYYVPASAIVETRDEGTYLSVTQADARSQGWDRQPANDDVPDQDATGASDYTAIQGEESYDDEYEMMPAHVETGGRPPRPAGADDTLEQPSGTVGLPGEE